MKRLLPLISGAVLLVVGCSSSDSASNIEPGTPPTSTPSGDTATGFASVQPTFAKCIQCHSGPTPKEGLDLSSYAGIMKGTESGPAVVAGKPDESLIMKALKGEGVKQMPPTGKLADDEIAKVAAWIQAGAKE